MWSGQNIFTWTSLVILVFIICEVASVSLQEDLTLTYKEGVILEKFRKSVESQLPHEYMKSDIYLIRWLRARNFDLNLARTMLFENLEWRRKNRMDTIHEEDWSDYTERYRFWYSGKDNEGRPIAFLNIGSWDLRRAVISGEQQKFERYLYRCLDLVNNYLRELQAEGKNISQLNLIADMAGFSLTQQGCLQCIPLYVTFVSTYETRFPGIGHHVFLTNTPSVFEVVLAAIRPLFSPPTRKALRIFGTSRQQYEPELFKEIERNQLPRNVGGTDDGTIYNESDDGFEY